MGQWSASHIGHALSLGKGPLVPTMIGMFDAVAIGDETPVIHSIVGHYTELPWSVIQYSISLTSSV